MITRDRGKLSNNEHDENKILGERNEFIIDDRRDGGCPENYLYDGFVNNSQA